GYDQGGFNQQGGFDQNGYDQNGFNQQGGYDQGGYDQNGFNQQAGYDQGGFDQNGFNQQAGYDQNGFNQQGGYDQNGFNQQAGYDQNGFNQQGGFDQNGYDQGGFNQQGFDQNGFGIVPQAMQGQGMAASTPPPWMQELQPEDPEQNYQTVLIDTPGNDLNPAPSGSQFFGPPSQSYPQNAPAGNMQPLGTNFSQFIKPEDNSAPGAQPAEPTNDIVEQRTIAGIPSSSSFIAPNVPGNGPAPIPSPQPDPFLEAIMRQAQMGIFAMPDKDNES
ncbi:MAG TPA: hypothetical protein VGN34_31385, partial [Ktedonobacteraceae bacterium]